MLAISNLAMPITSFRELIYLISKMKKVKV